MHAITVYGSGEKKSLEKDRKKTDLVTLEEKMGKA